MAVDWSEWPGREIANALALLNQAEEAVNSAASACSDRPGAAMELETAARLIRSTRTTVQRVEGRRDAEANRTAEQVLRDEREQSRAFPER